jgi:acylphosphatase
MENVPSQKLRRVSLVITGTVQGVFYRRDTAREAYKLGLAGFVKNEPDGSVYAEAEGLEKQVGALIRWCRRGPTHARVEDVRVTEIPPQNGHEFHVKD